MVNPIAHPELLDLLLRLREEGDAVDIPDSYSAKIVGWVCHSYQRYTSIPYDELRFAYRRFPAEGVYEVSLVKRSCPKRSALPAVVHKRR